MKEYPNFYENVKEALMRLRRTVVLYDGRPYVVLTITDHKGDGIFRIYLEPIGRSPDSSRGCPEPEQYPPEHPGTGPYMDIWMKDHPESGILRKQMNSPLFNKFRPYPLGMCNIKGSSAYYIERQPNRKTEQGLISSMLYETPVSTDVQAKKRIGTIDVYGPAFRDCVIGDYPSAKECLAGLSDPSILNDAVAFSREFAFARGPIGMIFLAYKHDIIGVLPRGDFGCVRIGRDFCHTKEVVAELGLFQDIDVR